MEKRLRNRIQIGAIAAGTAIFGCCGSCFVRGTRIATPRGPRPIEELAAGDRVWSYDVDTKAIVERAVAATRKSLRSDVIALRAGELTIRGVTPDHPIYDVERARFVEVGDLTVRSVVLAWIGSGDPRALAIDAIERTPSRGEVDVWDLEIDGPEHDFFADGILAHNKAIDPSDRRFDAGRDAGVDAASADDAEVAPSDAGAEDTDA